MDETKTKSIKIVLWLWREEERKRTCNYKSTYKYTMSVPYKNLNKNLNGKTWISI